MAAILRLTTGVVYVRSWSGTLSGGNLTLSGPLLLPDGTVGAPSLAFASVPGKGIYSPAASQIGFVIPDYSPSDPVVGVGTLGVYLGSVARVHFSSATGAFAGTYDLILSKESTGVLQLGADAAGVIDQHIKGPDRITTDGAGGALYIEGGRNLGASAGGSVIFRTAPAAAAGVAGTLATRFTIDSAGSLWVGVAGPSSHSSISSGGSFQAAEESNFAWYGRVRLSSPADGQVNLASYTGVGFGFDGLTDGTMKVRTRAQTGYATVDALGYSASGTPGFNGTVTTASLVGKTITITNGIITGFA